MKKIILYSFILFFIFLKNSFAQVDDIGIGFSYQEAYIEEIDRSGFLLISCLDKEGELSTDVFSIDPSVVNFNDLQTGDKVSLKGEKFDETGKNVISSIKLQNSFSSKTIEFTGRIEAVNKDVVIVDGNKVVLSSKGKIKGLQGYKNKKFTSVRDLKLGAWATIKGKRENGVTLAKKIQIFPSIVSNKKRLEQEMGISDFKIFFNETFFPEWNDKETRKQFLGKEMIGFTITNSENIQEFVNQIGLRLVPDYMKSKMNFSFVVVDDMSWNAFMTPVGLCIVHMGLLSDIENEAQLAAVLGHEIAHAVYQHSIQEEAKKNQLAEKSARREKRKKGMANLFTIALDSAQEDDGKVGRTVKKIEKKKRDLSKKKDKILGKERSRKQKNQSNNLLDVWSDIQKYKKLKRYFEYNQNQELQSDRVGLYYLVSAGYDPNEASKVWKKQYQRSYVYNDKTKVESNSFIGNMVGVLSGETSVNEMNKKGIELKSKKSFKTHPDNLKRFKSLNALISFYWSRRGEGFSRGKGFIFNKK